MAVDEEFETAVVHVVRLGERERFTHEPREPLPQSVDPSLDMGCLAFLLANGLMVLFEDRLLVGLPQVAVAGCPFVELGDGSPQTLASRSATIALHESHNLTGFSA